jgi:hypothetical protein
MVKQVADELTKDVWRCHAEIQRFSGELTAETRPEAEFWLRTFVRALFAQVEGVSYALRHLVLFLSGAGQYSLSLGEQCVLREVGFRYQDGKPEEYPVHLRLIDSLELGVHHFARAFSSEVDINKGDHRFAAFRSALALRHALTHPKNPGDLALSPDQIREFANATGWFSDQMVLLFSASVREMLEERSS